MKQKIVLPATFFTLLSAPSLAIASLAPTDPFYGFANTVLGWASGALGTGLAVLALLVALMAAIGVDIGASQKWVGNPLGAVAVGLGLALILSLGPEIIVDMMSMGAMLPY